MSANATHSQRRNTGVPPVRLAGFQLALAVLISTSATLAAASKMPVFL